MRWLLCTALVALLTGGCMSGPDESAAAEDTDSSRERVVAATREVAEALGGLGKVHDTAGGWKVCGSPPAEAVEYRASGLLDPSGDRAETVRGAADALVEAGWTVTDEGDDPEPWANLERDDVTASLRLDRMAGSEAVSFAVAGECVRVADDQSNEFDFSRQPITGGE